jgi:hypothetical protein
MGAWGFGILHNDTARDVYDAFFKCFNAEAAPSTILTRLKRENRDLLGDPDDEPLFWMAVARAQWECGCLAPAVLKKVENIVRTGSGLDLWDEAGEMPLARRKRALETFLKQLQKRNDKVRKPRRPKVRSAPFSPGDCLAIDLANGTWGAAIVTAAPEEGRPTDEETFGTNVVAMLGYRGTGKPTLKVFEARKFRRNRFAWLDEPFDASQVIKSGFRKVKERFHVVGQTRLRPTDPRAAKSVCVWKSLLKR